MDRAEPSPLFVGVFTEHLFDLQFHHSIEQIEEQEKEREQSLQKAVDREKPPALIR